MSGHADVPQPCTTPMQNRYSFWYKQKGGKTGLGGEQSQAPKDNGPEDYENSITELASFQTVENFWKVYNHINRPADLPAGSDIHLFREGIKPAWEDPNNCKGGHWTIRLKKGLTSYYWEALLFAIIGEKFDVGNEICGLSCSIRHGEDVLTLWNRSADRCEVCDKINEVIRKVLSLPQTAHMEYRRHDDSLFNISGSHGGHGGGRGDHYVRQPWSRNYTSGGRRRFDRKEPDGGPSVNSGERSSAPQYHSSRPWEKNRRPNTNSGDNWEKDKDKGMNRWVNVRRHNSLMVDTANSGTSGVWGPNSVPTSNSRPAFYGSGYDHRDDHANSQLGGGEGGGTSKSSYNSGQCTERERDWSKLRSGGGNNANKTTTPVGQARNEEAS